jgi:transcriptional regulator with XRE-family HTH domain
MNRIETSLNKQVTSTPEGMRLWQQERVILEVTERICELMEEQGINRSQLADLLDKSRAYITQILRGNANLTLRSISDIYLALGRQFHADDAPIVIDESEQIYSTEYDDKTDWLFPLNAPKTMFHVDVKVC